MPVNFYHPFRRCRLAGHLPYATMNSPTQFLSQYEAALPPIGFRYRQHPLSFVCHHVTQSLFRLFCSCGHGASPARRQGLGGGSMRAGLPDSRTPLRSLPDRGPAGSFRRWQHHGTSRLSSQRQRHRPKDRGLGQIARAGGVDSGVISLGKEPPPSPLNYASTVPSQKRDKE